MNNNQIAKTAKAPTTNTMATKTAQVILFLFIILNGNPNNAAVDVYVMSATNMPSEFGEEEKKTHPISIDREVLNIF